MGTPTSHPARAPASHPIFQQISQGATDQQKALGDQESPTDKSIEKTAHAALLDKSQVFHLQDSWSNFEAQDEQEEDEFKHEDQAERESVEAPEKPSAPSATEIEEHRGTHLGNFFASL